jgi:hypothetical protein
MSLYRKKLVIEEEHDIYPQGGEDTFRERS